MPILSDDGEDVRALVMRQDLTAYGSDWRWAWTKPTLLFTDPPYADAWLPGYEALGRLASDALVDGGSLITYVGHHSLPVAIRKVLEGGGGALRYWWLGYVRHAGPAAKLPGKWVEVGGKPLLWFVKGGRRDHSFVTDFVEVRGRAEKKRHPWAQHVDVSEHWIARLTVPGEVVADPLCGSGTTLAAAFGLGRRSIGLDLDEAAVTATADRLRVMQAEGAWGSREGSR